MSESLEKPITKGANGVVVVSYLEPTGTKQLASGGVVSEPEPERRVHTFTSSGTFDVCTDSLEVSILIVGAGGGAHERLGGREGKLHLIEQISIPRGAHKVIVGTGGYEGHDGGDSKFDRFVASGGRSGRIHA